MHRARGWDGEEKNRHSEAKFSGTWEVRIEHDGDRFTFKLLHYELNRNVGDPHRADTILVEHTRSIEDGFYEMKKELAKFIPEELF